MPIVNEENYYGEVVSSFVIKQFMFDLTNAERVDFILQFGQYDERKPATDRNFQMRKYWIDGERTGAARPHYDILEGYIVAVLSPNEDTYTFCETLNLANELEARHPDLTFKIRQNSYSDDIHSIAGYVDGTYLESICYVASDGIYAHVRISDNSGQVTP